VLQIRIFEESWFLVSLPKDLELFYTSLGRGRAIGKAASRRLPTAASRVQYQVRSCGICGGLSGSGAGFLRILRFPLPILVQPTAPISGRRTKWTQSHRTTKKPRP
jgi:hypothetical protein